MPESAGIHVAYPDKDSRDEIPAFFGPVSLDTNVIRVIWVGEDVEKGLSSSRRVFEPDGLH
jgi:hypothetical protein